MWSDTGEGLSPPLVRCVDDIARVLDPSRPVVTLFSGGLDSSYLLKLLFDARIHEVVALVVNVGDEGDLEELGKRADRLGARLEVVDVQQEFASDFVLPALQAQARYLGAYPISSSLSRPLMAKVAIDIANRHKAQAILHSAHPSQNTLRRLNGSLALLGFDGVYGTPYEWTPVPRPQEAAELADHGITELADRSVSVDTNLWCREFEAGVIDDPERFRVPEELYVWTRADVGAPRRAVTITFEHGLPTHLDGVPLDLVSLVDKLNWLAGAYQVGRYWGLEHLSGGEKVLEAREMPAAHVLLTCHAHLLNATVDAETIREKAHLDQLWVREAVEGRWFGRLRLAAQQFIESIGRAISGAVTVEFSHGSTMTPLSIRAEAPLYVRDREVWEYNSVQANRRYSAPVRR
ncbi:argininosuccinate synthase-related protein [Micromonospora sp. NPDC049662]|uniref:argininosuccinate synthase-related protein n=1 Tax=Micromonospora sp. NPDC049662 TaxID=3155397 RepID=UPI003436BEED